MKISEEDLKKIIAKSLNVKPTKIVNDLNSNKMEEWDFLVNCL